MLFNSLSKFVKRVLLEKKGYLKATEKIERQSRFVYFDRRMKQLRDLFTKEISEFRLFVFS